MKRRLVIIVLALILAAVGAGGVLAYAKGANARAIAGMKAVSVLVAQKTIPAGTAAGAALHGGLLASQTLPASSVPANALSAITPDMSLLVLSTDLQPGQLLLRPMLVTPAQTTSGLAIPPGMMALTLSFCLPEVVAGAVQAGAQVAIFDTVGFSSGGTITAGPGCTGAHTQVGGTVKTRVVLTRVLVLSVGAAPPGGTTSTSTTTSSSALSGSSSPSSGQAGTLVTLAVTQVQAEQLIQMTETGMPYLALLTTNSHTTSDAGRLLTVHPAPPPTPNPVVTVPLVVPSTSPTAPVVVPTTAAPPPSPKPSQTSHKPK
jgi:pilus assembly protein CpaB